MVSKKKKPDWPPHGWKVEVKLSKGRKVKCYINSKTHQKFYSKLAVLRYMKNEGIKSERSNAKKGHAEKSSGKMLVEANDSPEWLPTGWIVEWRTRKSGPKTGTKYKCYIDPSTGSKFFSKPEVSRYLETIQGSAGSSGQKKTGSSRHSSNSSVDPRSAQKTNVKPNVSQNSKSRARKIKVVVERTTDEELPSGWIKETRNRMMGNELLRRDSFYHDPASGLVFRSKLEVLRYVETGEISRHAYRRRNFNGEEIPIEQTSPSSSGKRGRNNKPLIAGEITPNQNVTVLPEARGTEEAGSKRSKRSSSRIKPTASGQAKQSASLQEAPGIAQETPPPKPLMKKVAATEETEGMTKPTLPNILHADVKDDNATLRDSEPPSAPSSGIKLEEKPKEAVLQGCSNGKTQTSKKKIKDKKLPSLPSRSSKRLAGVEAKVDFNSIPIEHALRATNRKSGSKVDPIPIMGSLSNETRENPEHALQPTNRKSSETEPIPCMGSISNESLENPQPPDVDTQNVLNSREEKPRPLDVDTQTMLATQVESSSKCDSSTQENPKKPEIDLQNEVDPPGFSENPKVEHSSINLEEPLKGPIDLEKPPLEGQIDLEEPLKDPINLDKPLEDPTYTSPRSKIEKSHGDCQLPEEQRPSIVKDIEQPESQFCFPLPLWSDPCLEFAYKTLTGAIPLDDNLAIEDYIQHQLRTSSKQSNNNRIDMGLPSFNDVSSQFDVSRQDLETKTVTSLPEDISCPNSNGFSSQKSSR